MRLLIYSGLLSVNCIIIQVQLLKSSEDRKTLILVVTSTQNQKSKTAFYKLSDNLLNRTISTQGYLACAQPYFASRHIELS